MMKLRILSAATQDLTKSIDYYESQSDGLGYDFLDEYEKTISRIWRFPEAWMLVTSHLRKCLMRRFPYAVFYTFDPKLKSHKLHGKLAGLWACKVEYDSRIVLPAGSDPGQKIVSCRGTKYTPWPYQ